MKMACWTCNRQEKSPSRLLGGDFLLSKKKDEDGLVQGSYKSDQAEDNTRDIGNKDRPVLVLLQKGVVAPKGAVDGGNQRLHGIAILAVQQVRVSRMLCKKGNFVRMNWQF